MVGGPMTLHEHVVDVYFHGLSYQLSEDLVDHQLEGCSDVLQSKRHLFIAIDSPIGDEFLIVFFWWMHL